MKFIGSLIILMSSLFGAQAYLSKSSVVIGESVVLILSAEGRNVKFPQLSTVGGFQITSTGTKEMQEYINGKVSKKLEKHYSFLPLKSTDIPPFKLEVDGKKVHTKALHVEVKKADYTNSPFTLEMKIKKTNVMQFEGIPVEFTFKIDENMEARKLQLTAPKFKNFWVKEGKKSKQEHKNGFIIQKMNYFIFPQKSGDFEISPARVDVAVFNKSRDIFNMLTNQLVWKTVFSNTASLHVKKLEGTNLYGDFFISFEVDKKNIEQDKGLNATLKITGSGNFDDIQAYKLNIDGANIYSDKPSVKSHANIENIEGKFEQKFSISSSKDFTIPSLSISYFDAKSKKIVTKKTAAIDVHVKSKIQEKPVQVMSTKKEAVAVVAVKKSAYINLIFAFIAGVFLTLFAIFIWSKKEYKLPKFKNDKEHLKALLKRRGESQELDEQIRNIENKLYKRV